jgi:hypothetical protein
LADATRNGRAIGDEYAVFVLIDAHNELHTVSILCYAHHAFHLPTTHSGRLSQAPPATPVDAAQRS